MNLTEAQIEWLVARPHYCLCGKPRAGLKFKKCGMLYVDGRFVPFDSSLAPIELEKGCLLVGVTVVGRSTAKPYGV